MGYRSANGDVNFAVRKFPGYGKLSGKSLDSCAPASASPCSRARTIRSTSCCGRQPRRASPRTPSGRRRTARAAPAGTSSARRCASALLGEHFDIHGGGQDLQFPHHENEIAQSEGANGGQFVNVWMHNGLLNIDDEKMSKSLGNFFTIRDVLKRFDGETIRFFMMRTHYRSAVNFSDANLDDARARCAVSTPRSMRSPLDAPAVVDWSDPRAAAFRAAMNDDFNTPDRGGGPVRARRAK